MQAGQREHYTCRHAESLGCLQHNVLGCLSSFHQEILTWISNPQGRAAKRKCVSSKGEEWKRGEQMGRLG